MNIKKYRVTNARRFTLADCDTKDSGGFASPDDAKNVVEQNIAKIAEFQSALYAEGKTGLLIVIQAMDAAGKDSAIKHVLSGINPQGVDVHSFKQPSPEELAHDYLWRAAKELPARGKIAIFNRSYYEDVLIAKVHKLYEKQNLPDQCKGEDTIKKRYNQIRHFEKYLEENGIAIVKLFLHVSKETQRKRFLERIDEKDKNWKFSTADLEERKYWNEYQDAYQAAIAATATKKNPWYIIPADKKWFTWVLISDVLLAALEKINPKYPSISKEKKLELEECRKKLSEK